MRSLDLPFQPIRRSLYTPDELFAGYHPDRPDSFPETTDFAIYRHFVTHNNGFDVLPYLGMMQALHDQTITQGCIELLNDRRVVAVMGGHRMQRGENAYRAAARLARRLTRAGMMICSGGGPGAMEAAHLGAALAPDSDQALSRALAELEEAPGVPDTAAMVGEEGEVDPQAAARAHAWFRPAYQLAESLDAPGESLAVPTWHYGHEPTTPFATRIAKYFQNSIREAGLTALAKHGIIFTAGKAGTIQEIFQDSNQNYYRTFEHFSPMVFLGVEYWTETYPVIQVLQRLFAAEDFREYVLVTDDPDQAAAFVEDFRP